MMCRVYVRVKPLSAEEVAVGHKSVLKCQDGHRLQCTALGSVKVHSFHSIPHNLGCGASFDSSDTPAERHRCMWCVMSMVH